MANIIQDDNEISASIKAGKFLTILATVSFSEEIVSINLLLYLQIKVHKTYKPTNLTVWALQNRSDSPCRGR
jgi:hypothetical protein